MKNRKIPYGYCYVNGEIVVHEQELVILQELCKAYIGGQSLGQLVERLNRQRIEYMPSVTVWNKSRVMRLLEDERYLGKSKFPAIIDEETHNAILSIRDGRSTQTQVDRKAEIFEVSNKVCCPVCHSKMRRRCDKRKRITVSWICSNRTCGKIIGKEDKNLLADITEIMNQIIMNPERIKDEVENENDKVCRGINVEIAKIMDEPKNPSKTAENEIIEYVSALYEKIGFRACQTRITKDIFTNVQPTITFDYALFARTVDEVCLYIDGTVGLILENRQEIRKEEGYATR